jgi:peptidoglycan/xylan/chitin deacetylase (PgdA/CDA1 family)
MALLAAAPPSKPRPRVVWTFDDGPTKATDSILPLLKRYKVKATFFVLGWRLTKAKNRARLRRIAAAGHTIGNHLWSHASPCGHLRSKRWRVLTKAGTLRELRMTRRAILATLRSPWIPKLYRAPFGDWCHARAIRALGYRGMSWHVGDRYYTRAQMWRIMRRRLKRRQRVIVLFHYNVKRLKWLLRKVYGGR